MASEIWVFASEALYLEEYGRKIVLNIKLKAQLIGMYILSILDEN